MRSALCLLLLISSLSAAALSKHPQPASFRDFINYFQGPVRVFKEELSRRAAEYKIRMAARGQAAEAASEERADEDPEKVDWLKRHWDEYQAYLNFEGDSDQLQAMLEKTRERMRKYEEEHARKK